MTFIAEKRKERKHEVGSVSRVLFKQETRRLYQQWAELSDADRQVFSSRELTNACHRRDQRTAQRALDEVAAARLQGCRFGLSDQRFPLGQAAFEEVLQREVGSSELGFMNYSEKLRPAFLQDVVMSDVGSQHHNNDNNFATGDSC
jgi:hypothetical protein